MGVSVARSKIGARALVALQSVKRKRDLLSAILKLALAFTAIEIAVLGLSDVARHKALMAMVGQVHQP